MLPFHLVIPLVLASLWGVSSALFYRDITSDNFDKLIDSSQAAIMLEFYAPWCGHCKALAPEYERLGTTFATSKDIIIAQVDADKNKDLGKRFGISGFPSLKWVAKGGDVDKPEDVTAGRTADELLKFVNEKMGTSKKLLEPRSSVTVVTGDNFKDIVMAKDKVALVGFFAPWCGHCKALKPTWEQLATLYADEKDVVIGSVDCDEEGDLAAANDVQGFPHIKIFGRDAEEGEDYNEAGRSLDEFVKFVNEKAGLDITTDGGVSPTGGVVAEIAEHIKSFVAASSDDERKKVTDTCHAAVEKLDETAKKNFKYYVKVFKKIADQGVEFASMEKARLLKMLESPDNLKASQKRNFMRRVNVLSAFDEL